MKGVGWILDVRIEDRNAAIWLKTENGCMLTLTEPYLPDFFVESRKVSSEDLATILSQHLNVVDAKVEGKYLTLEQKERIPVVHVVVDRVRNFRKVLSDIERLGFSANLYNTDLLHIQRYLFKKGVAPTDKVSFEHEDGRIIKLRHAEDDLAVPPPPFTQLLFGIDSEGEEVESIMLLDKDLGNIGSFTGNEGEVIKAFDSHFSAEDPDIVICSSDDLALLLKRTRARDIDLTLGRERPPQRIPRGRIFVGLKSFIRLGFAGIVERTLFTFAPPNLSSEWQAGKTIDSRQCYEAYRRGILIPKAGFFQHQMLASTLVVRDQGGLVLSPEVGLHENVGAIDFESMFPNIIVRRNVSYETVDLDRIDISREGFLGSLTKGVLERRLHFKHLKKKLPPNTLEWLWCDQRQAALKEILVCIYGYSGCFANRFGNVTTYQEINRISRNELVKSMQIARSKGFETIYADNDCLFLKKLGASTSDYENLAEEIAERVGLPMALDRHFRFLVLLSQKRDRQLGAAKRYYGKEIDGSLFYRGIELRRHDAPPLVRRFQEELMAILLDAGNAEEVRNDNVREAWQYVYETCSSIRQNRMKPEDLVVSKVLRKPIDEYKSSLPHVIAAKQLLNKGRPSESGDVIDFIYVNTEHANPVRRVIPSSLVGKGGTSYDTEKYVSLVIESARVLLTPLEKTPLTKTSDLRMFLKTAPN